MAERGEAGDGEARPAAPGWVARSIVVDSPRRRVWEVISTPGILTTTHPYCAENPVERWPGDDSRDRVVYHSGVVLRREFSAWVEGVGFDLRASAKGSNSRVRWRIHDRGEVESGLSIHALPLPHLLLRPFAGPIRRLLASYLDSVLRGFEYHLRTGRRVLPNQFGRHPWCS